jgi:tetraacyldisaccharide-1-P 4'-kinase
VLGKDYSSLPKQDVFAAVSSTVPDVGALMRLDFEQLELLSKARTAPVGIVSAAGTPGTGKTHIVIPLAKKFMLAEDRPKFLSRQ